MMNAKKEPPKLVQPQEGPQTQMAQCSADIALYGGAAGGGKSFSLLLEPLRNYHNPLFDTVIFRRTTPQITNPGGLWDKAREMYLPMGFTPSKLSMRRVRYDPLRRQYIRLGCSIRFGHLEHEDSVYDWQGSEIALIEFDELTHFSRNQFFYMMSRNRSMSGVPGYIRAACNPDADSWVRELVDWWIGEDGYPIESRSGVVRYFIRVDDTLFWGNSKQELIEKYGCPPEDPKSFTFIPAKLEDNKILMQKDPNYLANLRALPRVERLRLLGGNWNIKASAGTFFRKEWFPLVDAIPAGWIRAVRFWDRAATKPNESNRDPDWTRGLKLYQYPDNTFLVADLRSTRDTPGQVEQLIKNTAAHDGYTVRVVSQIDPGSAGIAEADYFVRMLSGFDVRTMRTSKDKATRAKPVSAQSEAGNIRVLRAPWNEEFFAEVENFPDGAKDDIVDVLSGAFNEMSQGLSILDVL